MAISLYDLSVTNYLQTLGAMEGILAKGLSHFQEKKADPNAVLDERLYSDMAPFKFQVWATAHHSLGAIKGVKEGVFGPPAAIPATMDYAGLQKTVSEAREALQKVKPEEVDAVQGKDMAFQLPTMKIPFTAENFLMSFSLPNFYFHATTAYDILRNKGVPIGKRDFLGRMRIKS
jgi:uncharacterized protein